MSELKQKIINALENLEYYDVVNENCESLEAELIAKFEEEFEEKIRKHRNQIVLDVCEQIELGYHRDPRSVIPNITIKL